MVLCSSSLLLDRGALCGCQLLLSVVFARGLPRAESHLSPAPCPPTSRVARRQTYCDDSCFEGLLSEDENYKKMLGGMHDCRWLIFFFLTINVTVVVVLSHVRFFVPPWAVACQAPLSMGFSRQEYKGVGCIPFSRGSSQPRD